MKKFLVLALICALMGVFVGCMPTTDKMDKQGKQAAAQLNQIVDNISKVDDVIQLDDEKSLINVSLYEVGEQKVKVIKAVREITGLTLIESKRLVDEAPSVIKEGVTKEEAKSIKIKLEEVGATVIFE